MWSPPPVYRLILILPRHLGGSCRSMSLCVTQSQLEVDHASGGSVLTRDGRQRKPGSTRSVVAQHEQRSASGGARAAHGQTLRRQI
ncbi:MAG: hypothetical protein J3K34DRAFT_410984 [Monoraphidium minutum]|nr:MAG: hypothetical protein J3K34DRAFT_410984 [Monoraphidium minutum]